ncbi:D-threitol dehydrogenase [Microbispora rosea subsp. aerata]|nr:SDR family oxidoreductase [Microbispora rosea]GGO11527.1 D-threitol dehydrogenase [Microbispora rosea subsp. aerata]GIH55752.1 D-threitol dehydrogenase [Microbispora rosea subsp. aerata]GLJ85950.1 D-threitol dehydrogenase [Microbispora rosea subsp. aerata]
MRAKPDRITLQGFQYFPEGAGALEILRRFVLITGAAAGIGRATSRVLARRGYALALLDRDGDGLESVHDEIVRRGTTALSWKVDLAASSADEQIAEIASALSGRPERLAAVVNCAGVGGWNPVEKVTPDDWDRIIDVNLRGAFLVARHMVPLLRTQTGGAFVVIASDSARWPFPDRTAYCASKHGLVGFADALREELRPSGTRVSVLTMSRVDTGFNGGQAGSRPEALRPEVVAGVVDFVLAQPPLVEIREISLTSVASPFGPFTAVAQMGKSCG